MQKEKPILFSTEMVRAILEGRKTETRRIVKPQPVESENRKDHWNWKLKKSCGSNIITELMNHEGFGIVTLCPYGQPGDVLWVREKFAPPTPAQKEDAYMYAADCRPSIEKKIKCIWKPSIHMPKAAARIWLQVEEIKVERLQDITEESAIAEGIIDYEDGTYKNYFTQKGLREQDGVDFILAKGSFQSLWCSINSLESWDANPWVWVVKFKVLSTTGKPRTLGYQPDTGEYHFANKIIKP